jgi:uncharacterized protein (AIM24 family)
MQKIEGDGLAFVHTGGTLAKKELAEGEILKVDTGCIVGFTKDVDYDIVYWRHQEFFWWRRFILCHTSRSGTVTIVAFQPTCRQNNRICTKSWRKQS